MTNHAQASNASPISNPVHPAPAIDAAVSSTTPRKTVWREYFEFLTVTFIMFLFGMTFNVQAVEVPTGSMQNTILIGDHLLVNKFIFAPGKTLPFLPQREIRRGDIVVFKYPGNREHPELNDPETPPYTLFVKRVIGLPGDKLETRGTQVFINDQPLPEHLITAVDRNDNMPDEILNETTSKTNDKYNVYYKPRAGQSAQDDFDRTYFHYGTEGKPVIIPPGNYFMMGDNRDNSADSRVWGLVPRELIFGRPMFVLWSYDKSVSPNSGEEGIANLLSRIRWSRTGTLIK